MSRRETLFVAGAGLTAGSQAMPLVDFGKHRVSRLIVGGNPVSGNSHISGEASREMRDFFSAEKVKTLLGNCEKTGVNTWQSRGDKHILRLLNEYRLEGGRIQWIAQTASELGSIPGNIQEIARSGAIGIYHHGSQTDRFWGQGKIEQTREMLKVMRDAGVQVGLGTHIPEVIDYVESNGWDLDFYMACIYNLARSREEAAKLAGRPVEDEFFWEEDRPRMLERVRKTSKQCLIFKVYGAGRRCRSREDMLVSLREVFRYAKPIDAVVVGMFPKYKEQVRENCALMAEAIRTSAVS